jgi:hypothetical protein
LQNSAEKTVERNKRLQASATCSNAFRNKRLKRRRRQQHTKSVCEERGEREEEEKKTRIAGLCRKNKTKEAVRPKHNFVFCFIRVRTTTTKEKKVFLPFNDESRLPVRWQEGEKKTRQIIHSRSSYQY